MVHRNARESDDHYQKYNGLGGKMEKDEDVYTCMRREILEEAGIQCTKMQLRGTINWTNFGKNGEDWLGFVFLIEEYEGEPFSSNHEGDLEWVEIERLSSLPMWEGDRHFLPMVFDGIESQFHGYMPYEGGSPTDWSYARS